MTAFIIRRFLILIPTFLGITLVVFAAMKLIPGDPIIALLQDSYTEELAAELRVQLGLDTTPPVQYAIVVKGTFFRVTGEHRLSPDSQCLTRSCKDFL